MSSSILTCVYCLQKIDKSVGWIRAQLSDKHPWRNFHQACFKCVESQYKCYKVILQNNNKIVAKRPTVKDREILREIEVYRVEGVKALHRANNSMRITNGAFNAISELAIAKMQFGRALELVAVLEEKNVFPKLRRREEEEVNDLMEKAYMLEADLVKYFRTIESGKKWEG